MTREPAAVDVRIQVIHNVIRRSLTEQQQRYLDVSMIDESTSLRALPLDSITTIELIDHLNTTFEAAIHPEEVYRSATVGDLIALIAVEPGPSSE